MATYIYETYPTDQGVKSKRFEFRQSMNEAAFTKHPETGEPIRRVITGGFGFVKKNLGESIGMVDDYQHHP